MVGARSAAMGFNRLVDADIDARNPRTAGRETPSGDISKPAAAGFIAGFSALFIFSAAMLWPFPMITIQDMILNALAAGILVGIGGGIILKSLGSAGGLDILTVILFKKYSIRPGTVILVFNGVLMLFAAIRIPLEMVLYTLIFLFVSTHFTNLVIIGLSQRKSLFIISSKWEQISKEIMSKLQRGVTILHGEGGCPWSSR